MHSHHCPRLDKDPQLWNEDNQQDATTSPQGKPNPPLHQPIEMQLIFPQNPFPMQGVVIGQPMGTYPPSYSLFSQPH